MSSKNHRHAQMHKILSTSMMYHQNICPQWVSDTQLNYMSQYDFITYDLDQDQIDLIQRPFSHKVIAVKYSALIGYRNVRIIYLYKQKTSYQWETPIYNFMILPSLNFNEDFYNKKINIPNKKIWLIQNFIYYSDGQFVVFPILFEDHNIGIVYMGLANNLMIIYNLIQYFDDEYNSNGYKLSSMILNDNHSPSRNKYVRLLQNTSILFTKSQNQFIVISNNSLFLLRACTAKKQFQLLDKVQLDLKLFELQSLINSQKDSFTIFLTKTYLLIKLNEGLLLYYISDQSIILGENFNISKIGLENCKIGSISGSFTSNKFLLSVIDRNIIYQLRVNDMSDNIQYLNCIDLQLQHVGVISKVLISSCARNAAIFTLSKKQQNSLNGNKKGKKFQDVLNFSIFKIQLYTQLGIPQSSLYLKQIKYKNRSKRVNRLVMPKIYERLYSLTGSQVHTLQSHKISGVLYFDIHPHGFYMIVSESFNIKIYSLQYNSMNLLYSISLQNLKKVLYSPDGSCMVVFSSRKLKILDTYSFQVKYEICQKNNSIVDVCFGSKHNILLILYDNGAIVERSFYDFQKIKIYRIFSHNHRKITSFKLDERNQNIMLLLEDGCMVTKLMNNLTAPDLCLSYQDDQKISQFHIDEKNHAIFTGTRSGILRLHNISIQKFSIKDFTQISITQSQITAITSSSLQNYVYIGNIYGDITMIRYNPYLEGSLLAKSSKLLNNVAPKVSPYFSFDFQLISNTKFQTNSEQSALQDKLETLIQKIQHHSNNFRQTIIKSYDEQQKKYQNIQQLQGKNIYKEFDAKSKKIKLDIHFIREKHSRQKKEVIQQYQNKLNQLFKIQQQLQNQKKQIIQDQQKNKNVQFLENRRQLSNLGKQLQGQMEKAQLFYKKQNFVLTLTDLQGDYRIADADVLKTHNKTITQQLREIKVKSMELNKINSYLQTAKINIMSRRVQQQTLQHRIRQQLKMLNEINSKQKLKIQNLLKQLKSTQDLIHRIQNKVKNTPNNVISSDKADSDLCSYKIWMKSKAQQEVDQLQQYLKSLDEKFQDKSHQIVQLTIIMKKNVQKTHQLKERLAFLKQRLKNLRYHSVILQNRNINLQKSTQCKFKNKQTYCQAEANKAQKIASMEKVNQKAIYSQNRNLKIHTRKIKNFNKNNAQLLHQYQNLKYENKQLIDKQIQFQQQFQKIRQELNQASNQKVKDDKQNKKLLLKGVCSQRTSTHKTNQTPFLKYIRQRSIITKKKLKLINFDSASSQTPSNIRMRCTIRSQRSSRVI